jgi:hypothetical protein
VLGDRVCVYARVCVCVWATAKATAGWVAGDFATPNKPALPALPAFSDVVCVCVSGRRFPKAAIGARKERWATEYVCVCVCVCVCVGDGDGRVAGDFPTPNNLRHHLSLTLCVCVCVCCVCVCVCLKLAISLGGDYMRVPGVSHRTRR